MVYYVQNAVHSNKYIGQRGHLKFVLHMAAENSEITNVSNSKVSGINRKSHLDCLSLSRNLSRRIVNCTRVGSINRYHKYFGDCGYKQAMRGSEHQEDMILYYLASSFLVPTLCLRNFFHSNNDAEILRSICIIQAPEQYYKQTEQRTEVSENGPLRCKTLE